jgi:hypothetical protein
MAFGPIYPPAMRGAASHADSLCTLLSRLDPPRGHVAARLWLVGRRQEIECFLKALATDYAARRVTATAAAATLEAYLAGLHEGLRKHYGQRSPWCCGASTRATVVASEPSESSLTTIHRASFLRARSGIRSLDQVVAEELLADALVAGLQARGPR